MNRLRSHLPRQLSYANVMASVAVFFALGGVGYAATTINGNAIKKETIGAGKLKKGTLTSAQVKQSALGGRVIDESSLSTVPSAQTAVSATSAATATSATTATSADHATTADRATEATSADSAATADTATTAGEAVTLDGFSAEELQVTCPADTELFGGMCWDEDVRPASHWIAATVECAEEGGRLPSISELVAYVLQDGPQVADHNWSSEVVDLNGLKEVVLTSNEATRSIGESTVDLFGYRCLLYRSN